MKCLLINPRCTRSWFEFHPEKETYSFHTTGASPPIGLLYLATVLEENDYSVKIIDNDAERYSKNELLHIVEKEDPDLIGFSLLKDTSDRAHQNAKEIKEKFSDIKILYGGPLATDFPRKMMEKYGFVDYLLRGEAEETIIELFKKLESGESLSEIEGLAYRKGNEIKLNDGTPIIKDLDNLPHPDRSLLNKEYDLSFPLGGSKVQLSAKKYTAVLTSRGCSNNCKFCLSQEKGWRARSPKDVVNELEELYKKGYKQIFFVDNNFAANKERVKEICDLIIQKDLDIIWFAQLSAREGELSLFQKMKKAGCRGVLLGIESANKRILEYYDKPIEPEIGEKAVKNARKANIGIVIGTFIIGAPFETKEEAKKTIEFARKLDIDALILSKLTLKPNTALWNEMKQKGYLGEELINKNFEDTIKQYEVKSELSKEELNSLIDTGYSQFIRRPTFLIKTISRTINQGFRRKLIYLNKKGITLYLKEKIKNLFRRII